MRGRSKDLCKHTNKLERKSREPWYLSTTRCGAHLANSLHQLSNTLTKKEMWNEQKHGPKQKTPSRTNCVFFWTMCSF